jgi:predicted dehydrogenase
MTVIRWGMIGAGDVTEVKSGPGFQKARDSALAAVMRRTGHLAEDYARRHQVSRWYTDAEALIRDPEVDAVYIATPPDSHCEYTLMAAAAGKPVYVEKPMARYAAECQIMLDACQQAGVPLFVAYYRRALPRFLKVKQLVQEGAIGEVRSVHIRLSRRMSAAYLDPQKLPWRVQPDVAGGGLFVDLGSHMLDFLDDVLGPVRQAAGLAVNQAGAYPAEDHVVALFSFDKDVVGTGDWCFDSFEDSDWFEFVGTDGKLGFAFFDETPLSLTTSVGMTEFAIPNPPHVQQPLIQTIVDELLGRGSCPSTGVSGLRTAKVMDQILDSYRTGFQV